MNYKFLLLASLVVMLFTACKKDEHKIYYEGGTAPVLSAATNATANTINLVFANKDKEAVTFSWTNPDYQFTTGISSQDVSYLLEIDTAGANFTNPNRQTISVSKDLSYTITVGQLNDYLLNQLQLTTTMPHSLEVRVKASLASGAVPLVSNVLKFTTTPYAIPPKVAPPASGKLFIVGSATPGGWDNPVPVPSQEMKQISNTLYEITLPLTGGGSYLFLPVNGDWGAKYGGTGDNNKNNPDGDDFKANGGDLLAPAASGNYKIQVDFQRGKFTVTKL